MAYVPGYEHDVFVSYAHVDDCILTGAQKGWVTTLVESLKKRLAQKLGREEAFSLWIDPSLPRHGEISPQIIETLTRSATILIILSPGYVSSTWCLREADCFLKSTEGKSRSGHRIFVVERDRIADDDRPEALREIKGFRFWEIEHEGKAPRIYGDPVPTPEDKYYYSVLNDLAEELATELKCLRSSAVRPVAETAINLKSVVYLADVTDDLDPKRDEVRRYLEQAGMKVLPDSCYSREPSAFRRCVEEDLDRCSIFVQLLSELPGKKPPNLPQGYIMQQYDAARVAGKQIMQWREPELDLSLVSDPDHLRLLELETVFALGLEEFKWQIRENVDRLCHSAPPAQQVKAYVFVNIEKNDRSLANTVCAALKRSGTDFFLPLQEGTPKQMRKDLERRLLDCDAIIILYGTSTVGWVREQLSQSHKILARRDRPLKALAVFEGPPRKTCPLGVEFPGLLEIIDSTENFDEAKLMHFLERVLHEGVAT